MVQKKQILSAQLLVVLFDRCKVMTAKAMYGLGKEICQDYSPETLQYTIMMIIKCLGEITFFHPQN